ncbi:LysR substrate-binding domain-containing protein [Pseudomonas entomophila]|uniref:LysR substrate-binding domain-containing protein n=1 Tax=Pseudomonas entomophila TaxID=312306 RepID=UPI0023D8B22A|nr:LysR substrate-binding domain-containing protein [Pseudomonas entomophila]MDF0730773.1 LysR substrate-binding domain-containing protein [Pseudomonas entomophila]
MELRHLRYFVMVAQEKHFTRAAARLNMQQPPLSQQIRALEQELGFDLFIRHAKGVDLTAGGEVFLEEALDILQRVEQGAQKAARTAKGIEGNLTVGFTSSAASHPLIPRIIRRYRDLYPDVDIALHEGNARELTDEVADDRVDIGILRAPVDRPRGIAYHRLLNEELVLTLPVGHRLLEGEGAIALKDLADEPFILVRRPGAPGMYANLLQACRNAGFEPKVAFEVERMLTNVSLVAAGAGVSVVPTSMRGFHEHSVAYRPIRDAKPRLAAPITLLCRQEHQSPQTLNFIALARQLGGEYRRERRLSASA